MRRITLGEIRIPQPGSSMSRTEMHC